MMVSVLGVSHGQVEGVGRVGRGDAQRQDLRLGNHLTMQTRLLLQIIPSLHTSILSTAKQELTRAKCQAGHPAGVGVVKTRDGLSGLG